MFTFLVPVDSDVERAKTQARFVTSFPGVAEWAEVTVANAFSGADAPESMRSVERVEAISEAVALLEDRGLTVEARRLAEPLAAGIVSLAAEIDADLIVMGGRKQSPANKLLFGSVTQSVLLETELPVTVTGATRG
jgi:nucleotide-binding universal stress UspA family protein